MSLYDVQHNRKGYSPRSRQDITRRQDEEQPAVSAVNRAKPRVESVFWGYPRIGLAKAHLYSRIAPGMSSISSHSRQVDRPEGFIKKYILYIRIFQASAYKL